MDSTFDAAWFREVLGTFPTGVAVVTACGRDGVPAGMAVGSFTSASLDPPLVAFFPDQRSSTWPRIQASGTFCVNVLGADQEALCRAFAARGGNKFAGVGWRPAPSGSPILDNVVAWLDCAVEAVHQAGDHWLVLGRVRALDTARPAPPLVFSQGSYGRFTPSPPAARGPGLPVQLHADDTRTDIRSAGHNGSNNNGTNHGGGHNGAGHNGTVPGGTALGDAALDDAAPACPEADAHTGDRHAERVASSGEPVARLCRACTAANPADHPAANPARGGHPSRRT